jgi:two-component system CheB/CheR fusion protein
MSEDVFDALLDHLCQTRGFDFGAYKRASLKRRIDKRMESIGIKTYDAYLDHLEVRQDEFAALFNSILINVTSFFRDEPVWEFMASDVVPALIKAKDRGDSIRIWSAACASGEEPYTLAILFADALGEHAFRERVKIYATDVDEQSLAEARQATYSPRQVAGVSPQHLEKYFDHVNGNYVFSRELRRSVIFGRHDLIQDAPISRVDLVACRNALMYFNAETQARIIARMYFALKDTGILLLGKAEILFNHATMFVPLDLKRRIFRTTPKMNQRERLLLASQASGQELTAPTLTHVRMREAAFDVDATPQIIVDAEGTLVLANDQARRQFGLSTRDLGRLLQDLELPYRPAELRSGIDQAIADNRPITMKDVEWRGGPDDGRVMAILITPLVDGAGIVLGQKVAFADVTSFRRLQDELAQSKQELETAMEELQSTNEELETMNEELQSTNEELQTMNEELRTRSGELNEVNTFLKSILTTFRAGVAVIDRGLQIEVWNDRAEDLWRLRADEARGMHLLNLDIGLPMTDLTSTIREVLTGADGNRVAVVQATNRRGRRFHCRVTCSPLVGGDHKVTGAILIMEDQRDFDDASSSSSRGDGAATESGVSSDGSLLLMTSRRTTAWPSISSARFRNCSALP